MVRYIYSQSGTLMAEYTVTGHRNHLYFGGGLVATLDQADKLRFIARDYLGSARKVWEIDPPNQWFTNQNGNQVYIWGGRYTVAEEYAYDPYGKATPLVTDPVPTRPRFTGKERDTESGLMHFGARNYSESTTRWLSADPVTSTPTTPRRLNKYSYTLADPINFVDPDGAQAISLDFWCVIRYTRVVVGDMVYYDPSEFNCVFSSGTPSGGSGIWGHNTYLSLFPPTGSRSGDIILIFLYSRPRVGIMRWDGSILCHDCPKSGGK
jgi:RHS repeat-associated protein